MKLLNVTATAVILGISSNVNSALLERLDGLAYYDDEADLTWLADANSSRMNWVDANAWAESLTVLGVDGWRLPSTVDSGNDGATYTNQYEGIDSGYNISVHSEMSNLYYNVLDGIASYDTHGNKTGCNRQDLCLSDTGPFSNIQTYWYWSSTKNNVDGYYGEWAFNFYNGYQAATLRGHEYSTTRLYAWAVHDGDISAVPIPAAVWLFGSGLLGLVAVARRKTNA